MAMMMVVLAVVTLQTTMKRREIRAEVIVEIVTMVLALAEDAVFIRNHQPKPLKMQSLYGSSHRPKRVAVKRAAKPEGKVNPPTKYETSTIYYLLPSTISQ